MRNIDKINKYEHGERRTKYNLTVRSARYARTVHGRAKTPLVQVLTVANVPSDVLYAIDQLAAEQDRSRSSFVRLALQRIVAGYRAKAA